MNMELKLSKSIQIHGSSDRVWDTLTSPAKNSQFFAGTQIVTDWKPGSPILFNGEVQGRKYQDKGSVLAIEPGRVIRYNYWTGFSGLEDRPENYSLVTYTLDSAGDETTLTVTRAGFADEQEYQHGLIGWEMVLKKIKEITEV